VEVVFNNEHLLVGNLGRLSIILTFVASLVGAIAFWRHTNKSERVFEKVGLASFWLQAIGVVGIIASLFYIIYNHYFEYYYAWQHSSIELPTHYMISCFWEGQEGSFLLWMFWQAVLSFILVFRAGVWRSPVMSVMLLAQTVLSSMLLGIDIDFLADYTFGSNPFTLLREANPEVLTLPVLELRGISPADYLQIIKDGTGLNPLLQNYWMVIHPPVLFFGFASTIVPFAYAIAGLWTKRYKEWVKPGIPWGLVAVMVLGTGIIMGGIWAYESLSFGGYWAWDPVENASLVPWLTLIAAVHVMVVMRNTSQAQIITYVLTFLSFILILYATFLTRSGVLGDTSVHSFTDLGLSRQLLVFVLMFVFLPIIASFKSSKGSWLFSGALLILLVVQMILGKFMVFPTMIALGVGLYFFFRNLNNTLPLSQKEESAYSREFWMFVGSLVLFLSAAQIIASTSLPVFNKINLAWSAAYMKMYGWTGLEFLKELASGNQTKPLDAITHYNKWQIPFAIAIAVLTGFGQFFNYKKTGLKNIVQKLVVSMLISFVLTAVMVLALSIDHISLIILYWAATFAVVGNLAFMWKAIKWRWKLSGASIAHIGFALMLIGALISSAKKEVVSLNDRYTYGDNFDEKSTRENVLLFEGEPVQMANYTLTYKGDSTSGPNTYYEVFYEHNETGETFSLFPNAQITENMGLVANPDTRHYFTKDVFTHVTQVPVTEGDDDWSEERPVDLKEGDSMMMGRSKVTLDSIVFIDGEQIAESFTGHKLYMASLKVRTIDSVVQAKPIFGITDKGRTYNIFSEVSSADLRFNFYPDFDENGELVSKLGVSMLQKPYIIMKAILFPYINVLWIGTAVMIIGFFISILRRNNEYRKLKPNET
jgi:cytochrome c-type biogenesis protein CcmF